MRIVMMLLALLVATAAQAQKMKSAKQKPAAIKGLVKGPYGVNYKFVTDDKSTRLATYGDQLRVHLTVRNGADSLLQSTTTQSPEGISLPLEKNPQRGGVDEVFPFLSQGDSVVVYVNSDSVFKGGNASQRPSFIALHSNIVYQLRLLSVQSTAEAEAGQTTLLKAAAANKGLSYQQTASGLGYTITKTGAGRNAAPGDSVYVHYTGTLLDGKKFDSSVDRGEPFAFVLGQRQVIAGWDEGIALLNPGAKAMLFIPSRLAYGERGAGGSIGPNAPLMFEVELIKIGGKKN
jgi:FKBP-type peptidyl-prolyl cis-trans isomerase FkpA